MGHAMKFPELARRKGPDAQHIPWRTSQIHTGMNLLNKKFNDRNSTVEFKIANSLWIDNRFQLLDEYMEAVASNYKPDIFNVDFSTKPSEVCGRINEWISKATNYKINNMIGPGGLSNDTGLLLANAIYFKGAWHSPFLEKLTDERKFTLIDGRTIDVTMMRHPGDENRLFNKGGERRYRTIIPFSYYKGDSFKMVQMPYKGKEVSMIAILPDMDSNLTKLEDRLSAETIDLWISKLVEQKVYVHLPKFRFETSQDLRSPLIDMGIEDAFDPTKADFSGITKQADENLFIYQALHRAYIDVNEKGTEAAAATIVALGLSDVELKTFKADRPFLFMIMDNETHNIIFMGRVMNPSAGK